MKRILILLAVIVSALVAWSHPGATPYCAGALHAQQLRDSSADSLPISPPLASGATADSTDLPGSVTAITGVLWREDVPVLAVRWPDLFGGATLRDHVGHVVLDGTEEEMIGTDAGRVVALVENPQPTRNWPERDLPAISVGLDVGLRPGAGIYKEPPVSEFVGRGGPKPAGVSLPNLFPESLGGWFGLMPGATRLRAKALAPGEYSGRANITLAALVARGLDKLAAAALSAHFMIVPQRGRDVPPMPPPSNPDHVQPHKDAYCDRSKHAAHECKCHAKCIVDDKGKIVEIQEDPKCRAWCFKDSCRCPADCEAPAPSEDVQK